MAQSSDSGPLSAGTRLITLVSLPALLCFSAVAYGQQPTGDDPITVVVAELQGPDPGEYPVTETFCKWLQAVYSDYDNIEVRRISEMVPFDNVDPWSGDRAGGEIGTRAGADIFFWGAYLAEGLYVPAFLAYQVCSSPLIEPYQTMQVAFFDGDWKLSLDQVTLVETPPDGFAFHAYMVLAYYYHYFEMEEEAIRYSDLALEFIDSVNLVDAAGVHLLRASAYRNIGELEQALVSINEAMRIDPSDSDLLLSMKLQIQDEMEAAGIASASSAAVEDIPESAYECLYLAVSLDGQGEYESALLMYDAALERANTDEMRSKIYVDRSLCNSLMWDYDSAVEDARLAVEYDPENFMAHLRMGEMLYDLGYYSESLTYLDTAVGLTEESTEQGAYARRTRGKCYDLLGDDQSAIADFMAVENSGYATPEDHERVGTIYLDMREYEKALEELDLAIAGHYETFIGYRCRAVCLAHLGRDAEAVADAEKAVDLDPSSARTYWALGIVHALAGRYDEALTAYTTAIELETYPEDIAGYAYDRALILYTTGDILSAIADLGTCLECYPDDEDFLLFRGVAWSEIGEYGNARADLERCMEVTASDSLRQEIAEALEQLPGE
ncbi:MAG: tetratricopeptide repeat protein [Candidatus Fermentibacteraceae bacterium]|nr:tetratricopeptide repeat protein [Candidatus Fermentibacteraceae bacterium]